MKLTCSSASWSLLVGLQHSRRLHFSLLLFRCLLVLIKHDNPARARACREKAGVLCMQTQANHFCLQKEANVLFLTEDALPVRRPLVRRKLRKAEQVRHVGPDAPDTRLEEASETRVCEGRQGRCSNTSSSCCRRVRATASGEGRRLLHAASFGVKSRKRFNVRPELRGA